MSIPKLGKQAAKWDRRRFRMRDFLLPGLLAPPPAINYYDNRTAWGMMCNDQVGCCTIASKFHQIQVWVKQATGKEIDFADADILKYYALFDGYDPANPVATDNGGIITDVLDDWRKADIDGYLLTAYADPQPQNQIHVMQAIDLFGGIDLGFELPVSAQGQSTWDVVAGDDGGVWGGHDVNCSAYYAKDGPIVISWGKLIGVTWPFWDKYCSEAHALLSPLWPLPVGFNRDGLATALQQVTG